MLLNERAFWNPLTNEEIVRQKLRFIKQNLLDHEGMQPEYAVFGAASVAAAVVARNIMGSPEHPVNERRGPSQVDALLGRSHFDRRGYGADTREPGERIERRLGNEPRNAREDVFSGTEDEPVAAVAALLKRQGVSPKTARRFEDAFTRCARRAAHAAWRPDLPKGITLTEADLERVMAASAVHAESKMAAFLKKRPEFRALVETVRQARAAPRGP